MSAGDPVADNEEMYECPKSNRRTPLTMGMGIVVLVYALALGALAVFCVQLAKRNPEIAWGYWLAAIVLAIQAAAAMFGSIKVLSS